MTYVKTDVTSDAATPVRVTLVTMDPHLSSAADKARGRLRVHLPGLRFTLHAAAEFAGHPERLAACRADIAAADIVIVTMLFLEDHFLPILPDLQARRDSCDAMVCAMSAGEVTRLTRMGGFDMGKPASGLMGLLKRLKPKGKDGAPAQTGGAKQMKMLRRLPKILRYIPGSAQDVRAYFLSLQYWLAGSEDNITSMVRALVGRYAAGPRAALRRIEAAPLPVEYPEVGVYHPRLPGRMGDDAALLPQAGKAGRVGLVLLRSYLLAGNTAHYDGVIRAMEARGLSVVPVFAAGLDARPAIEAHFFRHGRPGVDAVVSLTGFSLVGGPAYNDAKAAEAILARLDVPYLAAHPVEFQTLDQWGASARGLLPVESTIMVAIPELDGATAPMVFGGRPGAPGTTCLGCERSCTFTEADAMQDMASCPERAEMLAARAARLIALRRADRADRRVATVLFNFPPNSGRVGTAAYLDVFGSLWNTLRAMRDEGYTVDLPVDAEALRVAVIEGNAALHGTDANVHALIRADDHVRRERWLTDIERQWGPAPGRVQSNGQSIFVLGRQFGNVLVAVQPGFGYEGDPMRLLFEKGLAPTHAFSAFYRYLREDFAAHAVLHFGTHGALEFMPGKQTGMSGACWPERLIGDLPNIYLYASNNPSEGALAKRRSAATLVSYLTPPVTQAGLYRGLLELKASLDRWRAGTDTGILERADLAAMIQTQAAALDLAPADPAWGPEAGLRITALGAALLELEYTLIPHGLHVVGQPLSVEARTDMLMSMDEARSEDRASYAALATGGAVDPALARLAPVAALLAEETELSGLLHALDARYIRPAPGGDVLRTPEVLPTGRNLHGFDPFRIPSAFAVRDGAAQADRLIAKATEGGRPLPRCIAMVLWGTDNLKSEGSPIAQALALMGTRPRFDSYGRIAGATLIPLAELGRARIDVVITLSGIFRDLLPLQIKLLAEAALLAASADEPREMNAVRDHTLAYQAEHGCDLETAALRVYGNADGAYGSNVNLLVESGAWDDGDELATTYTRRKGFAYGVKGEPVQHQALLQSMLKDIELTYQNLESVELGVTTVDTYFDTLGGITGAVKQARGGETPPVFIGDQTRGTGTVRSLEEQVALETRTRTLNPKWYEGMLQHGYEGVRQIEQQVTNTLGWSATTGQVEPWVYQKLTETFLLDPAMRDRLAALNPQASSRVANRLLEASQRSFWSPDDATLRALTDAADMLEDRLEGVIETKAA